jgi:hypothetical protein
MAIGSALEDNAKLGLFIHKLREGYAPAEAGQIAHKFIFDYFDIPKSVQASKNVLPFITWYYKNIPLQLEYMVKKPYVFQSIYKTKESISEGKGPEPGVTSDFYRESYPVALKKKGMKLTWFPLARWLPLADVNMLTQPNQLLSSVWPGLKAPVELAFNKDLYFNRPIQEGGDRAPFFGTYIPKRLQYALRQFRPIADIERLNPADLFGTQKTKGLLGLGQRRGGKEEPSQAARIARTLTGLRFYETDIAQAKDRKISELEREALRLRRQLKWNVDEKEKKRIQKEIENIRGLISKYSAYQY